MSRLSAAVWQRHPATPRERNTFTTLCAASHGRDFWPKRKVDPLGRPSCFAMSTRAKLTPAQHRRLARLTERTLKEAERKAAAGEPVSARELNGIRRLIVAQESDEALERAPRRF